MPKDDLMVNSLQLIGAVSFQIPNRFGQQCVGDKVLGLGQPHVLHILLRKLLAVQIQVISHIGRPFWLLLIAMLLLLLLSRIFRRLAVAFVDEFLVARHFIIDKSRYKTQSPVLISLADSLGGISAIFVAVASKNIRCCLSNVFRAFDVLSTIRLVFIHPS